ncbi:complement C2 [Tachyglossus aculeatus]|uniref:complement C2 n=1 Tax=Tachyglossus aculeatus TaxID=9261 RepID=UPI0018F7B6CA|nr:complement C2 [Tachyglossus aculeatus]
MSRLPVIFLLLASFPGGTAPARFCSQDVTIRGGSFSLSDGLAPGSRLMYACPSGYHPHPVGHRLCKENGRWHPPRTTRAACKAVRCPAPAAFENGYYTPRLISHPVGGNLTFECEEGYRLRGSPLRHCRPNGLWDGETAVCDGGEGHCPDPGIPVGTTRTGSRFTAGDRVRYHCTGKLTLIGSAERECRSNGAWSGAEPICRSAHSFDFLEDVAPALGTSFAHLLAGTNPLMQKDSNVARRISIQRLGLLNLYLLLDASQSVSLENFKIFKESAEIMVDRLFSFEVNVSVGIMTFASKPKTILSVQHPNSRDVAEVFNILEGVQYKDHQDGTGTNTLAALRKVSEMMSNQRAFYLKKGWEKEWKEIHHAIILLTDGKSNMGGTPKTAIVEIKEVLDITPERENYLDIYAIGVGDMDMDWKELNEMASKKDGERHAFILRDPQTLRQVFENMLDISKFENSICGLGNVSANATDQEKHPWHVTIKATTRETCRGSLISDRWVLTAAHCFHDIEDTALWRVTVGDPGPRRSQDMEIEERIIHEGFDALAKRHLGIPEFYHNDIALLKLKEPIKLSSVARPICLPCTSGANVALKRRPSSTCRDHESDLLNQLQIPAHFISLDDKQKNLVLRTGKELATCARGILQPQSTFANLVDVGEVVTEQFLCSGLKNDDSPCKGESGGSVFFQRRSRFFQVGLVSWGLHNPCSASRGQGPVQRRPHPGGLQPRDFHLNLFRLQPWLRQHLAGDLVFLPLG